jgi:predicted PurR-regulated permease PerM
MMKTGSPFLFLLILTALVVVLAGLRSAGTFFLPFFAALFLAWVSSPLVNWLHRRLRSPRPLALAIAILANLGVLAGTVWTLWMAFDGVREAIPRYRDLLHSLPERLPDWAANQLDPSRWSSALNELGGSMASTLTQLAGSVVIVFLLLGFLLAEEPSLKRKSRSHFGTNHPYLQAIESATAEVRKYLVIKTLISAATGILTGLWLGLCGVDFPVLWGFLMFVLNYIPSLGPALAVIPPFFVALLTQDLVGAGVAAGGQLTIGFIVGNLVEPPLVGKQLGLAVVVVFLSMFFWGWMWGPVGALFAVPLTMILRNILAAGPQTRWLGVLLASENYIQTHPAENRPPSQGKEAA